MSDSAVVTLTKEDELFVHIVRLIRSKFPRVPVVIDVTNGNDLTAEIYNNKLHKNVKVKAFIVSVASMSGIVTRPCIKSLYKSGTVRNPVLYSDNLAYSYVQDKLKYCETGIKKQLLSRDKANESEAKNDELAALSKDKAAELIRELLTPTVLEIVNIENQKFKSKEDIRPTTASSVEEENLKELIVEHFDWIVKDVTDNMRGAGATKALYRKGEISGSGYNYGSIIGSMKNLYFIDCCNLYSTDAEAGRGGTLGFFIADMQTCVTNDGTKEEAFPILIYGIWSKLLDVKDVITRKSLINGVNSTSGIVMLTKERIKELAEDGRASKVMVDAVTKKRNKLFYNTLLSEAAQNSFLSMYELNSSDGAEDLWNIASRFINDINQEDN